MWKTMAWEGNWQSLLIQYWYIYYFHQIIFMIVSRTRLFEPDIQLACVKLNPTKIRLPFFVTHLAVSQATVIQSD